MGSAAWRTNGVDSEGNSIGFFIQTSPNSDRIVGYSGPTNTLIAFDSAGKILGIEVLSSGDTVEHVQDVMADERFMTSFDRLTWEEAAEHPRIDAVSGATLTSLAIPEGIRFRLGGTKPSLRFPNEVSPRELENLLAGAATLKPRASAGDSGRVRWPRSAAGRRHADLARRGRCNGLSRSQRYADRLRRGQPGESRCAARQL